MPVVRVSGVVWKCSEKGSLVKGLIVMSDEQKVSPRALREYAKQHAPVLNENFAASVEALRQRIKEMQEQEKRRAELSKSINMRLLMVRKEIRELNQMIKEAQPLSGVGKDKFADMFDMTAAERRLFMLEDNIGELPTVAQLPDHDSTDESESSSSTDTDSPTGSEESVKEETVPPASQPTPVEPESQSDNTDSDSNSDTTSDSGSSTSGLPTDPFSDEVKKAFSFNDFWSRNNTEPLDDEENGKS